LCIETSKELRTRLAEVAYVEYADQSLTKQLVTCSMDTAYPPIRNNFECFNNIIIFNINSKDFRNIPYRFSIKSSIQVLIKLV
jgi:hypothetical protein